MIRSHPSTSARVVLTVLALLLGLVFGVVPSVESATATTTTASSQPAEAVPGETSSFQTSPAEPTPGADFVQATSAILLNADDGRVIYEKNADERRPMASTTKIMTGLIAIESLPLDQVVTASKRADQAGESEIWLVPGEQLTVEELLYALLVKSANDAAVALAEASAGSLEAFVERMNAKAQELGLENTHFDNPHGLDSPEHYSSARDLAELGRYAMQNEQFRRFVGTAETTISWPGRDYDRVLKNHNHLLGEIDFVNGIKTGYTGDAGYCLVGSGSRDGVSLIAVTLGEASSDQRNADTVKLLEWGFDNYESLVIAEERQPFAELPVPYQIDGVLPLVAARHLETTVFKGDQVEQVLSVPEELTLPVESGQSLGTLSFVVNGQPQCEVDLVAAQSIESPTLGLKARYFWDRFVAWLGDAI